MREKATRCKGEAENANSWMEMAQKRTEESERWKERAETCQHGWKEFEVSRTLMIDSTIGLEI